MMHRPNPILLLAAFAVALAVRPATADEIGGSGFAVPQGQNDWLWGIEGLVRTPVDLSGDFGALFLGYELEGEVIHDDRDDDDDDDDSNDIASKSNKMDVDPIGVEGGFRLAGGIGYWNCCVLIEPALSFRANNILEDGNDRTENVFDPSDDDEFHFAEIELRDGWELAFGPQITWIIRDGMPVLDRLGLSGLPLVFFPYLGVAHAEWDVELEFRDSGDDFGTFERDFRDDALMVGFDLDVPLPGAQGPFTHALTFAFRWIDADEDHDLGPFNPDVIATSGLSRIGTTTACGAGTPGDDQACFNFSGLDGWQIGLYYRLTWNDFSGFFKKNIFGPLN